MNWLKKVFARKPKFSYISPMYKGPDIFHGYMIPPKSMEVFHKWMISTYGLAVAEKPSLETIMEGSPAPLVEPKKESVFYFLYWQWVALN